MTSQLNGGTIQPARVLPPELPQVLASIGCLFWLDSSRLPLDSPSSDSYAIDTLDTSTTLLW
ncbi:hypothetical protein N7495_007160 [Penicillium taxi]|uniref:uncharacterized protein n=1 Tax=Penicillium taxi TaxID=168475 RepID=UPI002544F98E|nr:uncharacterized protein N7495_007160 [Penicillium taxi]KAJ5895469.1 hypothetical protein N7495_007160 [Penicillium taxi]